MGLTLLECILALALSAVLLNSLITAFAISRKNWKSVYRRTRLVELTRLAMTRLARELKYAEKVTTCCNGSTLTFQTRYLLDDDDNFEEVSYTQMGMMFYRSEQGGPLYIIGGAYEDGVSMLNFEKVAYKKDVGGNLVPLEITDPLDMIDAVWFRLNFLIGNEPGSSQASYESLVALRNAD